MRTASHFRLRFYGAVLVGFLTTTAWAAPIDPAAMERALMQGRVAEVITGLNGSATTGPAHLLLCRAYYAEQLPDPAIRECEAALTTLGKDSVAQDWMGRVYGLKADKAGPLTGYSMAKKVKTSFEAAVSLDPKNGDAVDDLADYYLQAPGMVGGGVDKAADLATRIQATLPQRAQRLRGLIAEKRKDYGTAERELRAYVDSTGGRTDALVDLGAYYGRRHELDKAADTLRKAYAANTRKDASLVFLATTLTRIGREPDLATKALLDYLSGSNWSDSAPTFQAHTLLGRQYAAAGNKVAAKIEYGKALALAPDYEPARKAMAAL